MTSYSMCELVAFFSHVHIFRENFHSHSQWSIQVTRISFNSQLGKKFVLMHFSFNFPTNRVLLLPRCFSEKFHRYPSWGEFSVFQVRIPILTSHFVWEIRAIVFFHYKHISKNFIQIHNGSRLYWFHCRPHFHD